MSTEIVKAGPAQRGGGALSLAHMSAQEAWRFAEALAGASLLPGEYRNNPGSVLWAMEYGRALGLDVVTTITTIHVIKGKPTQSADLMLSRAREAGHRVRIQSDRERCVVRIVRHDDPDDENVIEWTLDDAKQAGLYPGKADSNWAKYPRAMLRARAIAECVRAACPEVLHGAIYTAEELGARVDDAGLPVEAEVTQLHRVQPGEPDQWATPAPPMPEPFQPHAEAQALADRAAKAKVRSEVAAIVTEAKASVPADARIKAPDTEQPEELRPYLTRRWKALPEQPPVPDDEVVEGEVVDEAAEAEQRLRAAADKAGLDNLDEEFERSYGLPIAEAGVQQLTEMTQLLGGVAA